MKLQKTTLVVVVTLLSAVVFSVGWVAGCGKAVPHDTEGFLGDAVVGDDGSRTDGSDLGAIYPVTTIVTATPGPTITGWTPPGDLPFTSNPPIGFNDTTQNRQVPFSFSFTFPPNNYQLYSAHLVIDTSRDNTDTEGIFVDGVVTGRPPGNVNGTSPKIDYRREEGQATSNLYFMQYSLEHYLQNARNTFDLDVAELLDTTPLTIFDVLSDGFLPVVTTDDSPVYQAFLVMDGYTISKNPLTCSTAGPFTFENVFLHNDGNSIGSSPFSGTIETPYASTTSVVAGFKSIEYYFDATLPRVPVGNVSLATGSISTTVARNTDPTAIVVNGVGVSQAGFDRGTATAEVERWEDGATATNYWNTLMGTIPTTSTPTAVTINLRQMLGESTLKSLIAQGKLNVSLAGGFRSVAAANNSSARAFGVAVSGPTLDLDGTYTNQVCNIPDNPDSPLQGGGVPPLDPLDTTSPQVISLQATEITATSASIVWLTDEGATTQVAYGIANTDTDSAVDTTLTTFHKVTLTGLSPYKYYYFRAKTEDGNGNQTISGVKVFRTLR